MGLKNVHVNQESHPFLMYGATNHSADRVAFLKIGPGRSYAKMHFFAFFLHALPLSLVGTTA